MKSYIIPELRNVSETLLVPLFCRAKETLENGIIKDDVAIDIVRKINYDFRKISDDRDTQRVIAVRTKIIDEIVERYIQESKNPVIVNLGAGLDTRHLKFEDSIKWYQLDLENAMSLRHFFFKIEHSNITKSILDFSWMDDVVEKNNVLFVIEGVLMYLDEHQVKSIFEALGVNFRESRVIFDTIPPSFTYYRKLKSIDAEQAPFKWGNSDSSDIEAWQLGATKEKEYLYQENKLFYEISYSDKIEDIEGFKVSVMNIN